MDTVSDKAAADAARVAAELAYVQRQEQEQERRRIDEEEAAERRAKKDSWMAEREWTESTWLDFVSLLLIIPAIILFCPFESEPYWPCVDYSGYYMYYKWLA